MNNPAFERFNPHPSNVRDLEPVIFHAGLNNGMVDDKYGKVITPETKLYIIKYIGTLEEIRDTTAGEDMGHDIYGKDETNYGDERYVFLYKKKSDTKSDTKSDKLNVYDLEPVIFAAGLNRVIDMYEKDITDNTKLYIIKYIGTLQDIQRNSNQSDTIKGNDNIVYGKINDVYLYKYTALEKFDKVSNSIFESIGKTHSNARQTFSEKHIGRLIKSYIKEPDARGRKTRRRKNKSNKSKKIKKINKR
jgi:hypothetical protein